MTKNSEISKEQFTKLVTEYIFVDSKKDNVEKELIILRNKIVQYFKAKKIKSIKSGDKMLYVHQKFVTSFPSTDEKGRDTVEEIVMNSKDWKHAVSFDITKLGQAYDAGVLSKRLRQSLKPFAKKEEITRVTVVKIKKK